MIGLLVPLDIIGLNSYTQLVEVISCTSKIYSISGTTLFCLCGWIASDLFQFIHDELSEFKNSSSSLLCLRSLKQFYDLVCQFTDAINQCFGWVMLISITYTMASTSFVCFVAVIEFQNYNKRETQWALYARDTVLLIQHVIHLAIITYIPHSIKIKV